MGTFPKGRSRRHADADPPHRRHDARSTGPGLAMQPRHPFRKAVPFAALLPMALVVIVGYLGSGLWSIRISLTASRSFPTDTFVGLAQYTRLFENERWLLSL